LPRIAAKMSLLWTMPRTASRSGSHSRNLECPLSRIGTRERPGVRMRTDVALRFSVARRGRYEDSSSRGTTVVSAAIPSTPKEAFDRTYIVAELTNLGVVPGSAVVEIEGIAAGMYDLMVDGAKVA